MGRGLFATRDLEPGDKVISEDPLVDEHRMPYRREAKDSTSDMARMVLDAIVKSAP